MQLELGENEFLDSLVGIIDADANYKYYLECNYQEQKIEIFAINYNALKYRKYEGEIKEHADIHRYFHSPDICNSKEIAVSTTITVIVYAGTGSAYLGRALDSILIQDIGQMEIIIIHDSKDYFARKYISKYGLQFPGIIRSVSSEEARGKALNDAIASTRGAFVSVLDATEIFSEYFFKEAIDRLCGAAGESKIDLFAAANGYQARNEFFRYGCLEASCQGKDIFELFIEGKFGSWYSAAKIYRKQFLIDENILFPEDQAFEGLIFNVRAFYAAKRITATSRLASRTTMYPPSDINDSKGGKIYIEDNNVIVKLANSLKHIADFIEDMQVGEVGPLMNGFVEELLLSNKNEFIDSINSFSDKEIIWRALNEDVILNIGRIRHVFNMILQDVSRLNGLMSDSNPMVKDEDRDWRAAALAPRLPKTYKSYGNADNPLNERPLLTVILPNYNKGKYIRDCLNSIFTQSMKNFELIVVDDASTDESWDILCDYADIYSNVRLYRMDFNGRQGICRNLAIDKVKGKYLTFVDSDDMVAPGFFAEGLRLMEKHGADMIAFCHRRQGGKTLIPNAADALGVHSGLSAFHAYVNGKICAGPVAKIYNAGFVKQSGCRFAENIYHQDHFFVGPSLLMARKVVISDFCAYVHVLSVNSSIRPASRRYLHSESSCRFLKYCNMVAAAVPFSLKGMVGHATWHIQRIFLPTMQAFFEECGELPLTEADYECLQQNRVFLTSLLRLWGDLAQKNDEAAGTGQTSALVSRPDSWGKPLVSVIVSVFNQEMLIGRCLDSILGQSMQALEVIVIDDASTDDTLAVCEEYRRKDPRVRILQNNENRGQGYSRNRGMEVARGEFIAFSDSDDVMCDFLQYGVNQLLRSHDVDFLQCAREEIEDGVKIWREYSDQVTLTGKEFLRTYMENGRSWWNLHGKIYRKNFLLNNNIVFPDHLYEDSIYILKTYISANKVIVDPRIAYRQVRTPHPASTMRPISYTYRHVTGFLAFAAWLANNFGKNDEIIGGNFYSEKAIRYWFGWPNILKYIATKVKSNQQPFSDVDIQNINSNLQLIRIIFEKFADIEYGDTGSLPTFDGLDDIGIDRLHDPNSFEIISLSDESVNPVMFVIVSAYNAALYISKCIRSILAQDIEGIEIIVIDDGSTDNTLEICRSLAQFN